MGNAAPLWKNRYSIEKELGRGGFGVVYLAHDQELLSKRVVIKVLQQDSIADPYLQKKFRQEMEALARLDHPGVVGVLDVGDTPEGKPFIVMQYIQGTTLSTQIPAAGMEFKRTGHILRQVGHALAAAHDKGIFHRDLKPDNIMLTRSSDTEEHVRLIDFGIAAVANSEMTTGLQASKIVGTLTYMAPEQAMGKATGASDIYSLGVIAFQMLTGQQPDITPQGVAVKPRQIRPDIPEGAEALILKALSFNPENRPSDAREFTNQLARALGVSFAVTPISPGTSAAGRPSSSDLEMAYILFMDIVEYSRLPMDLQSQRIQQLQDIVRSTTEFQRAQQTGQIVSLPTGDGMALVFFQNPTAPVQCAIDVAHGLKSFPEIGVRMGVHTGPVYRIADINTNRNVAGGGINLAQRVMDCGDAGHILVSRMVADILSQLSDWSPALHDLGEAEVKHGVKIQIVNFYTREVGNSAVPKKLRTAALTRRLKTEAQARTELLNKEVADRSAEPRRGRWFVLGAIATVVVAVIAMTAVMRLGKNNSSPPSINTASNTASVPGTTTLSEPSAPPAAPPENVPAPEKLSTPAPVPVPDKRPATVETVAKASTVPDATQAITEAAKPADVADTQADSQPETPRRNRGGFRGLNSGQGGQPMAPQQRMFSLMERSAAIGREVRNVGARQGPLPPRARKELADFRVTIESLLESAKTALQEHDIENANRFMDKAENHIQKTEAAIRRLPIVQ
jgi:serine/threonine protein kinase